MKIHVGKCNTVIWYWSLYVYYITHWLVLYCGVRKGQWADSANSSCVCFRWAEAWRQWRCRYLCHIGLQHTQSRRGTFGAGPVCYGVRESVAIRAPHVGKLSSWSTTWWSILLSTVMRSPLLAQYVQQPSSALSKLNTTCGSTTVQKLLPLLPPLL